MARRRSLKRGRAFRDPKTKITLVCEGKLTEPDYFYALAKAHGALVRVDLAIEKGAGVPTSVVEKAIELRPKRRKSDSYGHNDTIWAVFDRDEHPYFDDAVKKAASSGVIVAYSNPCFELWLFLHFEDWNKPVHRHEIQSELQKRLRTYDSQKAKRVDFDEVAHLVNDAVKRATTQHERQEADGLYFGNPSTSVYRLIKLILAYSKKPHPGS